MRSKDGGKKVKSHLELNLERDTKGNKEHFYRCIRSKIKSRQNVGWLLNQMGDLVTKDIEKCKVLSAIFTLIFPGTDVLQRPLSHPMSV